MVIKMSWKNISLLYGDDLISEFIPADLNARILEPEKAERTFTDLQQRFDEIQPKLPFETEVLCLIGVNDMVSVEKALHQTFREKRRNGEWFELAPPGPGSIVSEITNEDADTVTVPLPFTFTYYGEDYNTIGVCSNGFMEFPSSTYRFGSNTGIPSVGGPRAMIAPFWDDLDPSEAGDIYQYYDSAEHRWIIEFYQVDHYGGPGDYEIFQVILYDPAYYATPTGDGEIVVQYLVAMQQTGNTVGIENFSETIGIQYHYDGMYHE